MSMKQKLSGAFDAFIANSGSNDKRDAIVIYRASNDENLPITSKDRTDRSKYVKQLADERGTAYGSFAQAYQARHSSSKIELKASSVGSSVLPVAQVEVTSQTLLELAEQPDVVAVLSNQRLNSIEPTIVDYRGANSTESKAGLTWGLSALGIPELWNTTKGEHITVAVLDTGVYGDHACLSGRVQKFVLVDPLGRRIDANPSFDSGRHGTHVCGTIAGGKTKNGIAIGVAPQANLLAAGVLLGTPTLRSLIEGMSWAIENGADIINMSLAFTYYEPLFFHVFKTLIDRYNVLPVAAIGNDSHGKTSSPGNASDALSVGAARGKTEIAGFSSGASLDFPGERPSRITKPDIVAPGVEVYSSIPPEKRRGEDFEYSYMDGTSMASPHVAGVAALLMAAHPNAPVSDIAHVLKETARHPGGHRSRPDNRWGYGLIQPKEALSALSS